MKFSPVLFTFSVLGVWAALTSAPLYAQSADGAASSPRVVTPTLLPDNTPPPATLAPTPPPVAVPAPAASETPPAAAPPAAEAPAAASPAKPAPAKAVKKKRRRKRSHVKKHPVKKTPAPVAVPEGEKRGYDPSVAEPTEEVMAIKNRAQQKFWEGRRPLTTASAPSGIAAQPLLAPNPNNLERVSASELAGVTFDDQPLRMPETEAFKHSLDTVAFELGRPCRAHEYLGWPLQQTEQTRVDRIFADTIEKFRLRGYSIAPHQPRSAGSDVSVFTADRFDARYNRYILGLWSAGDEGLLLLLCETEPSADLIAAQHVKAKHKAAARRKKRAHPKIEAKPKAEEAAPAPEQPKVIPGAGAVTTTPETAPGALTTPEGAVLVPVAPVSPSAPNAPPTPPENPPPAITPPPPPAATAPPPAETPPPPPSASSSTDQPPTGVQTIPYGSSGVTPPASPDATKGKETPTPVEPAKPAAPPKPATAITPPADRGNAPPPDQGSRNFSGAPP